jgi:hypothetical protein
MRALFSAFPVGCSFVVAGLLFGGCSPTPDETGTRPQATATKANHSTVRVTDDAGLTAFGRWERVRGMRDGRDAGTSTRSFHRGDALQGWIDGTRIVLDGVTGPTGGYAMVLLDSDRPDRVDFYSPRKRTHVHLWERSGLGPWKHLVTITVFGRHQAASRGDYVNVDGIEAAHQAATAVP